MRIHRTFRHRADQAAIRSMRSCRGVNLLEFALVLMFFFTLIFCLFDFCWLLFAEMNMQDAVREAGRYASTGQHVTSPSGSTLSRNDSITQVLHSLDVSANITSVNISSVSGGAGSAGAPGDTVTIQAVCSLPFLTGFIRPFFGGSNAFTFTVSSTFKNEPFPPSQTK